LAGNKKVKFQPTSTGGVLILPERAPDAIASVVCLEIAGKTPKVATQ